MTTRERSVRSYASHLALKVEGKGPFTLVTKYGPRKVIGIYRSITTLERGITCHGKRMLREMKSDKVTR
jgi:hypothetical protein